MPPSMYQCLLPFSIQPLPHSQVGPIQLLDCHLNGYTIEQNISSFLYYNFVINPAIEQSIHLTYSCSFSSVPFRSHTLLDWSFEVPSRKKNHTTFSLLRFSVTYVYGAVFLTFLIIKTFSDQLFQKYFSIFISPHGRQVRLGLNISWFHFNFFYMCYCICQVIHLGY